MSFNGLTKISMHVCDVLCHKKILQPEIEKFQEGFERNERFRELDGLIVEALDDFERIDVKCFEKITDQLKKLREILDDVDSVKFSNADLREMDLDDISQIKFKNLADKKFSESQKVEHLGVILESN